MPTRVAKRVREYTSEELEKKPTLAQAHCCNLKLDTGKFRVWLCRSPEATPEHLVNYEAIYQGRWRACNADGKFA